MTETPLIPADEVAAAFAPMVHLPEDPPEPDAPMVEIDSDFDPAHREDFTGLLFLGKLEDECRIAGHRFKLVTPTQQDRLEMGPLHKPWINTLTAELAWRLVIVAAYLRRIDSEGAPEPLNKHTSPLASRFDWVRESIASDIIIERLYERCLLLDARVRELIEELDRLGESSA
jgi:hypothetical protein